MISTAPTAYHSAAAGSSGTTTKENVEFMLQQTEAATNYLSNLSHVTKMCSSLPWPLSTSAHHNAHNPLHHHHQYGPNAAAAAAAAAAALAGHHHNIESILGGYKSSMEGAVNSAVSATGLPNDFTNKINQAKLNYANNNSNNNNSSYDGKKIFNLKKSVLN
jgi:hypothetical protein